MFDVLLRAAKAGANHVSIYTGLRSRDIYLNLAGPIGCILSVSAIA